MFISVKQPPSDKLTSICKEKAGFGPAQSLSLNFVPGLDDGEVMPKFGRKLDEWFEVIFTVEYLMRVTYATLGSEQKMETKNEQNKELMRRLYVRGVTEFRFLFSDFSNQKFPIFESLPLKSISVTSLICTSLE